MRIQGVNIPAEKRLVIALTYIHGVGNKRAEIVCEKAKVDESIRVKDLDEKQEQTLRDVLTGLEVPLESDLKREVMQNIKRLQDINSYRGIRHRKRLPCRGQSTKTNSRTRRGKRATIANKKKVTK